jgi:nucleoside-diphosphate-sugar epimerase
MGQKHKTVKVALVGGAGLVGRAICRRAANAAPATKMVVFDRHQPADGREAFHRCDILTADLVSAFMNEEITAVVHLVAQVDPVQRSRQEVNRALHSRGLKRVLNAAVATGIKRVILVSSAVVYGARPENPIPLDETAPRRPNPEFPYAVNKAIQEEVAEQYASKLDVVILRPPIIYGPDADNYLTHFIRQSPGVLPAVDGCRPLLQFMHVDDVADAIIVGLKNSSVGTYNLAPRATATYAEVAQTAGLRVVNLPRMVVAPLLDLTFKVAPALLRVPANFLGYLQHPFVVSGKKIAGDMGFLPQHSTLDALKAMLKR